MRHFSPKVTNSYSQAESPCAILAQKSLIRVTKSVFFYRFVTTWLGNGTKKWHFEHSNSNVKLIGKTSNLMVVIFLNHNLSIESVYFHCSNCFKFERENLVLAGKNRIL